MKKILSKDRILGLILIAFVLLLNSCFITHRFHPKKDQRILIPFGTYTFYSDSSYQADLGHRGFSDGYWSLNRKKDSVSLTSRFQQGFIEEVEVIPGLSDTSAFSLLILRNEISQNVAALMGVILMGENRVDTILLLDGAIRIEKGRYRSLTLIRFNTNGLNSSSDEYPILLTDTLYVDYKFPPVLLYQFYSNESFSVNKQRSYICKELSKEKQVTVCYHCVFRKEKD